MSRVLGKKSIFFASFEKIGKNRDHLRHRPVLGLIGFAVQPERHGAGDQQARELHDGISLETKSSSEKRESKIFSKYLVRSKKTTKYLEI